MCIYVILFTRVEENWELTPSDTNIKCNWWCEFWGLLLKMLQSNTVVKKEITGYSTAHFQVYKKTRVMIRASRNFAFNLCVGLVRHEEYCSRVITDNARE